MSRVYQLVHWSCICIAILATFKCYAGQQDFTVTNSIELTTFGEPSPNDKNSAVQCSPDGRYCYVVTSRGIIKSNQVESTLWIFNSQAVQRFINSPNEHGVNIPRPVAVARIAAVPSITMQDAYAPVITDVRWTSDSRKIYFLGLESSGHKRLYEVDVLHRIPKVLTPSEYGVRQFDINGDKIAYAANATKLPESANPWDDASSINGDAGAITGLGLEDILRFPVEGHSYGNAEVVQDVWVKSGESFRHVPNPDGLPPLHDTEHRHNVLALSPDGRNIVRLMPIRTLQKYWALYDPKPGFESWRIDPQNASLIAPSNSYRLREYQLIDTRTGTAHTLVNAPSGISFAEVDRSEAVWSSDGRKLLLGNTMLPLNGVGPEEQKLRRRACALAAVDVPTLKAQCVVYTRDATSVMTNDNPRPERLQEAYFGTGDDEVILQFAWHGKWGQTEHYRYKNGKWNLAEVLPGDPFTGKPLLSTGNIYKEFEPASLTIRQSLNDPPTLWATDRASEKSKLLWNPNPQLNFMKFGKAELYHWKDKSGYAWSGVLITPPGFTKGHRYPLVIQTHGFTNYSFIVDGSYPTAMAARPLSSVGIVILQTDGRIDHFATSLEAHDEAEGWKSVVLQLDADGIIDASRVGIIGFSRTCWHVEQALISYPDLFAAATVADGMDSSYMQYMLFSEGRPALSKEYETLIGTRPVGDGLDAWLQRAPSFHLDKVITPLRIEALNPSSVLIEWELYASLRRQGKPVDMIYIPRGQHILQKPLDRLASQQGNVDWFRFWLQGYEDPSPEKVEQYRRWRDLRARTVQQNSVAASPEHIK